MEGVSTMPPVTLTPIATGFNNPIGIDYHEPTDQVILSVNWPSGQANNFEIKAVNQRSIPEARRFIGPRVPPSRGKTRPRY
jgi:hypothetical protein